ncbi:MAG: peptidase T, partial [Bacteroidaceae bacterium]|nr:peptidase T [Bacteroidaceae bacterium]
VERFLKYVSFDTQSSEEAEGRCPSTEKQLRLAEYLVEELKEIGMQEVEMDAHGYVFATLPASEGMEQVPVVGFIAHMDTSPDCSGADVKPRVVENYDGSDIVLDEAEGIVTRVSQFPELLEHKGEDLIVTDGHTLLGADDKAGIAEIMSAMAYLLKHPEVKHGKVRVCFNPDEEIGCGAHLFDVEKFGCQWAYTMDGSEVGELEYENFNAASAKITVNGISVHPGYAKDKMVNAALLATEFAQQMPENEVPERTTGYEGFFHLYQMQGGVEQATLTYIIRDHNTQMFQMRKQVILDMCERMNEKYGHGTFLPEVKDTYYNMHTQLVDKPHIIEIALRAIEEACGFAKVVPIRGGTDGAQLSFKGLPCPNIFAGGLNFHGRHEFLPIQSMEKAMQTVVNICRIVSEKYA